MTPEGRVKHLVKKMLAEFTGLHAHWPVQNGMGSPTLDCIVCCRGYYVAIETKAPGKHPTPRQELTIEHIKAAGGLVFVISNDREVDQCRQALKMLGFINASDRQSST
jgi:hypothetical protein